MYDFGIIGGDIRQTYVAEYLAQAGYSVFCYGIENVTDNSAKNLEELINSASKIIAPVPFSKDGRNIFIKNSYKRISIEEFAQKLNSNTTVLGGAIPYEFYDRISSKNIRVIDILKNADVEQMNTIATAEGTIAEAICSQPTYLYASEILIIGYGKCGKVLASKMNLLGGKVTICARRLDVRKEAGDQGYSTMDFGELCNQIGNFEYIFNTVPVVVLDEKILGRVRKDAVIIDIASMPGGVDFASAEKMNLNCRHCLGLPGKYCPGALAKVYVEQILDSI